MNDPQEYKNVYIIQFFELCIEHVHKKNGKKLKGREDLHVEID